MSTAQFLDVNPVLPVYNMTAAVRFYTEQLGFRLLFSDPAGLSAHDPSPPHPAYAVVGRDNVRLHLQSHDFQAMGDRAEPLHIRFLIEDVDSLYAEYAASGAPAKPPRNTPWGTREFGLYDPDKNGLFFYRDL